MLTDRGRYDEIRSLYIDQLASVWITNSTTETTRASFDKKIESFARGELEHATEMLSALWGVINKDGEIKAPSNTSPAVGPLLSHFLPCCAGMLIILHVIRPHRSRAPLTGPL